MDLLGSGDRSGIRVSSLPSGLERARIARAQTPIAGRPKSLSPLSRLSKHPDPTVVLLGVTTGVFQGGRNGLDR